MDKLTKEQAAIISAYTGYLLGSFSDMQELAEKKFGRPVWTHEFADKKFANKLRELLKEDFISLSPKDNENA